QEGVGWFGTKFIKPIVVKKIVSDSQIVSHTIPASMVVGQTYNVNVVVKNTGSETWTAAKKYKFAFLGTNDPFYNYRLALSSTDSILPGQTKTFTFAMKAPPTEGTYISDWQMAQEGVGWFGTKFIKPIVVKKIVSDSQIVSHTIPASMVAGQTYNVNVVVKNTGSETWTAAKKYKFAFLGTNDPFYNYRLALSSTDSILPGHTKTFTFAMKAPSTEGTYTSDWQMAQEGVGWFGTKFIKHIIVK
ncbi:hypothetical protein LGK95_17645, partial [Clostridium algoriphilum]|uniref:NBR1-Ig-like domain-containing protein n=1 Tax=Clostridium algoriphilum TaxID=198347 RepID=UPI001CF3544F